MPTMQERIDTLVKMRREKPELKHQWEQLKARLLRLIPEEKTNELRKAFDEIEFSEAVDKYDQLFHEVLITGKKAQESLDGMIMVDEDGGFGAAPIRREGSVIQYGAGSTGIALGTGGTGATWGVMDANTTR